VVVSKRTTFYTRTWNSLPLHLRSPTISRQQSSLGSKLISSNAPTYDFYLRELLRSELTYLLTFLLTYLHHRHSSFRTPHTVKISNSGGIGEKIEIFGRLSYGQSMTIFTFV